MDFSGDSTSSKDKPNVFVEACRSGLTLVAAAVLIEMTKKQRKEVLTTQITDENDEMYTPFLLATRKGHLQLVGLLLKMFAVNPNDKCHVGNLSFENYMVEGATPLWCAAAISNFEMVKLLIEYDADINQCTSTNSSPLRASCFCGSLQIVKFLIEKGADIEIGNLHLNTALMVASYRGHLEVVEHLLDKGANPNALDNAQCTALHFAVDGSQLDIVKELVNKGCDINIVNSNGITAPASAADNCNSELVDYFCNLSCVTPLQKITLLELLGASYANDKDCYDTEKAYHYFYLAILLRENEGIAKQIQPPVEAYLNRKECETRRELHAIKDDLDAVHMESLIVRERILGSDNIEIPHPIVYRGAVYADGLQFSRGVKLWQRALELKQRNDREVYSDLYRFAEVFSQMVLLREEIDVDSLTKVLESCLMEAIRTRKLLEEAKHEMEISGNRSTSSRWQGCPHRKLTPAENVDFIFNRLEGNIHVMLYLLLVVTKTVKTKADTHKCGRIIYRFVKLDFRDRNGCSPLHLVLDESTPVDDFHVKDVCSFPNSDITELLLSCGADPNATCNNGNTPLHLIVQYAKPISDFMTLHQAITNLLDAGAHPDTRNHLRQSPLDLATTGVAEIILKKESSWSLKCFAARVVRKHNIPYVGHVPVTLEEFIKKH